MNDESLKTGQSVPQTAPLKKKKSHVREYGEALFTALLIALFLRAFVIEAFKIPSKSMVPTLLVGDHIFVNKFAYGIRVPFTKKWITHFDIPERGEVAVFIYPKNEHLDFIKRVVGLPGDTVALKGSDLFINDKRVNTYPVIPKGIDPNNKRIIDLESIRGFSMKKGLSELPFFTEWGDYFFFVETLGKMDHFIQRAKSARNDHLTFTIPPNHLFVMGDNRDHSSDSREWGFVPMENLKGRAMFVWLSIDHDLGGIRWNRFGKWIE